MIVKSWLYLWQKKLNQSSVGPWQTYELSHGPPVDYHCVLFSTYTWCIFFLDINVTAVWFCSHSVFQVMVLLVLVLAFRTVQHYTNVEYGCISGWRSKRLVKGPWACLTHTVSVKAALWKRKILSSICLFELKMEDCAASQTVQKHRHKCSWYNFDMLKDTVPRRN